MKRDDRGYRLDDFTVRALSHVIEASKLARRDGLHQEHRVAPNVPLTAGEHRDLETIERAARRLLIADAGRRR
jgi:hypothetical protein